MAAESGPTPFGSPTFTAPGLDAFAVTPSNSVNFNIMARALYIGVGGNVTLVTSRGNTVEFIGVPDGSILPVVSLRVNSTSTTATSIVGII